MCENNLYGFSTHYRRTMAIEDIATRGKAYGMPGYVVDGMDVGKVYSSAGELINRAREGDGPTLLECKTYRYRGHSRFEPASYRTKEELLEWKLKDPIPTWANTLKNQFDVAEKNLEQIHSLVDEEIVDAVRFAENSADPDPEDYRKYIYA